MEKERKELREQVRSDLTLLEENKKLKADIEALRISGIEMGNIIASLKSSIGSYKSANTRIKNELDELKTYAREADELNEQKANRIIELEKQLDAAVKDVEFAHDANKTANEQIANVSQANKDLSDEICDLYAKIEWYNALPWYRKIFVTKI